MSEVAGRDFEYLAGAFFADLGFKVYLTASSKDGGFDLVALQRERDGTFERLLVECKSSPKGRVVGVGVVRALFGVAHAEPSTGGICVSSTYFSREAREFHRASAGRLSLVEGEILRKWLRSFEKVTSVAHDHAG
jgi:restriction system protein